MANIFKRCIYVIQEISSLNWLTAEPIKEHNYVLNKQQFQYSLQLRHNWLIPGLPSTYPCGGKFNLQHALFCKKDCFINIQHNEVSDTTARFLSEVCEDVRLELPLG